MRIIAGIALFITGFVWLGFLSPGSYLEKLFFGQLWAAWVAGGYILTMGIFHLMPRPWLWGDDSDSLFKKLGRALWALMSIHGAAAGLLFFLAMLVYLPSDPFFVSALEAIVGTSLLAGSASQLRAIYEAGRKARAFDPDHAAIKTDTERLILQVARAQRGRVTAAEVAADTTLSYREATELLAQMSEDGLCAEKVMEEGTTFFYFAEFAGAANKRDMLDDEVVFDRFDAELGEDVEEAAVQKA